MDEVGKAGTRLRTLQQEMRTARQSTWKATRTLARDWEAAASKLQDARPAVAQEFRDTADRIAADALAGLGDVTEDCSMAY